MRTWPFSFTQRIELIEGVADLGAVPVEHMSEATFAQDATGQTWVRKTKGNVGEDGIIAEAMGALLGVDLGVLAPKMAFYDAGVDDESSCLSERVLAVTHWDPKSKAAISNPQAFAAMMVLDALIMNSDRHWKNVLCQPDPDEKKVKVYSIDCGAAIIGRPWDFARKALEMVPPRDETKAMNIPDLRENTASAVARARILERGTLVEYAQEACWLAKKKPEAVDVIAKALFSRCSDAERIVNEFLKVLGGEQ